MTVALSRRMHRGSQETTMFEAFKLYRHACMIDLDMLVVSVVEQTADGAKLKVRYLNRFYKFFQPAGNEPPDEVFVKKAHFPRWVIVG